jgi:THO complex subunit 2
LNFLLFQCSDTNDQVDFENFRHLCHKWHFKITRAIVTCLSSKDYIQVRNAFVILMHIQNHFPVLLKTEQVIQKRVEKVRDEEKNKRQDLHVLASSYLGILKQKCSQLIPENEFHQFSDKNHDKEKATNGDSKAGLCHDFLWPSSPFQFPIPSNIRQENAERPRAK